MQYLLFNKKFGVRSMFYCTGIPVFEPLSSSDGIQVLVDEHSPQGMYNNYSADDGIPASVGYSRFQLRSNILVTVHEKYFMFCMP